MTDTDITKLNEDILEALRGRGLSDSSIRQSSPEKIFDEYCDWHGLVYWGPRLRDVLATAKHAVRTEALR